TRLGWQPVVQQNDGSGISEIGTADVTDARAFWQLQLMAYVLGRVDLRIDQDVGTHLVPALAQLLTDTDHAAGRADLTRGDHAAAPLESLNKSQAAQFQEGTANRGGGHLMLAAKLALGR